MLERQDFIYPYSSLGTAMMMRKLNMMKSQRTDSVYDMAITAGKEDEFDGGISNGLEDRS